MPTLFRLLTVIGLFAATVYAAMFAVTLAVRPQPREIVEAVALPSSVTMTTGRSAADGGRPSRTAAEMLNSQASALAHHHRKHSAVRHSDTSTD